MEVGQLVPTADSIPVAWGWFKFLLLLTFALHLLLMNLMLGGSLLTFAERVRGRATPPESRSLPTLIALTISLGVPPLLFLQVLFGTLFYSSSVLIAVFWISVIPILIAAYYAAHGFAGRANGGGPWPTVWLGLSSVLLLAIGFVLSNNMTLMLRPERWTVYFDRPDGSFLNLSEPTLIPRYLHFVVASLAIAGLGRAVYHAVLDRRNGTAHTDEIRSGLRVFALATMIQMVIGVLFWVLLPGRIGSLFLGGSVVHSVHLWVGIVLAAVAIVTALRARVWATTVLALGVVVIMVLVRDLVRTAYLAGVFHPRDLTVVPQMSPMILFFVSLVAVAGILVYVLRQAWRAKGVEKREVIS